MTGICKKRESTFKMIQKSAQMKLNDHSKTYLGKIKMFQN